MTAIGSVVFNEDAKQIKITFNGSSSPSTVTLEDGGITLETNAKVVLKASNVFVGSDSASEPIPLGSALIQWLGTHTHPTAMGPTLIPVQAATLPDVLSKKNTVD